MKLKDLCDLTINELLEIINSSTPKEEFSHLKTSDVIEEFKKRTQMVENLGNEKLEKETIIEVIDTFPVEELDVDKISELTNLGIDKIRKHVVLLAETNMLPAEKAFYLSNAEMQLQLFLMLQKTNKELVLQIDNLTKTINKNSEELNKLRIAIDSKTMEDTERLKLKSDIESLEKLLSEEKSNLEKLEQEKSDLIEKYQKQNEELIDEKNSITSSLEEFKINHNKILEEKTKEIEELENKIKENDNSNSNIDTEALEKLKNEYEELKEKHTVVVTASESEINDKNKEIELLKKQLEDFSVSDKSESKNKEIEEENQLLTQKVQDLENALEKINNEKNDDELKKAYKKLEEENTKLKKENAELETELEELETEIENLKSVEKTHEEEPEISKKERSIRFGNQDEDNAKKQKNKKQKTIAIIIGVTVLLLFVSFFIYLFISITSEVDNTQQPQNLGSSMELKSPTLEKQANNTVDNTQNVNNQSGNLVLSSITEENKQVKEAQTTDLSFDKPASSGVDNTSLSKNQAPKTNDFVDLSDAQFNTVETIIAKNKDAGTEMLKEVPNKISFSEGEVQKISSAITMNVSGFSYENINYIVGNDFFGNKIVYINDVSKKIFFLNNTSKKTFTIVVNN